METKFIKIYGLPRSGSNYIEILLKRHTNIKMFIDASVIGWKHGPVLDKIDWTAENWEFSKKEAKKHSARLLASALKDRENIDNAFLKNGIGYVFTTRNIYSWVLSDALKTLLSPDELRKYNDFQTPECIKIMVNIWNKRNREYLQYKQNGDKKSSIIAHNDLLSAPEKTLDSVLFDISVKRNGVKFCNEDRTIGVRNQITSAKFNRQRYVPDYYKHIYDGLCSDVVQEINKHIDIDVMHKLGFEIMSSQKFRSR